jgi:hypothetical protein
MAAWKELWKDPNVELRNLVKLNGLLCFTMAGTQFTLLPLLMVSPLATTAAAAAAAAGVDLGVAETAGAAVDHSLVGLGMSAPEIGVSFAFMSLVSFFSAQPMAYLADKYGKIPSIVSGGLLVTSSIFALPFTRNSQAFFDHFSSLPGEYGAGGALESAAAAASACSEALLSVGDWLPAFLAVPPLLLVLVPFSLGTTVLNSTPTALMGDLTDTKDRAQGMSLLRTSGDLGFLLGTVSFGGLGK